jgi:hypothetical protein
MKTFFFFAVLCCFKKKNVNSKERKKNRNCVYAGSHYEQEKGKEKIE